eukprot:TRINITY_DN6749_c0_g1_i1.p1 TRINITY_DN6749_c0_g1~~TRINITY_DN6749_c0_g1_i1.p1  ORF type:complete len:182 (+),score=36.65 TRINITY_DN6749_c0_g1_i1:52-597(+)
MSRWAGLTVTSLSGETVPLASLWANQRTVVALVRRFGCVYCHHQATLLLELKPELDRLGVKLVCIGNGSAYFAQKFKEGVNWPGDIYLDPDSSIYKALQLKRWSMWEVTKRFFFSSKAIGWAKEFTKKYKSSDLQGDGQQSGGVLVLTPGVDEPLFFHKEMDAEPTVFADNAAILAACRRP